MKKIYLFIILTIIVLAAAWLFRPKELEEPVPQNQTEQKQETVAPLFSTTTISQSDAFYNMNAEYPQFSKTDDAFNSKIKTLITDKIDAFKKDAKDYWDARKATAGPGEVVPDNPEAPFEFISKWTPVQINDKYISFVIDIYYFSGGAHGINEIKAFNYDIGNKKEITVNDFLNSSPINLQKVASLASKDVKSQLQAKDVEIDQSVEQMIDAGTKATAENFANFNFKDDEMIIYFQQYQVAPGAYGPITVNLLKQDLVQKMIESDYLK